MTDKVLDLQLHLNKLNELKIHEERETGGKIQDSSYTDMSKTIHAGQFM